MLLHLLVVLFILFYFFSYFCLVKSIGCKGAGKLFYVQKEDIDEKKGIKEKKSHAGQV